MRTPGVKPRHTYTLTDPAGVEHVSTSVRDYTHVVWAMWNDEDYWRQWAMCSREDLAFKRAAALRVAPSPPHQIIIVPVNRQVSAGES